MSAQPDFDAVAEIGDAVAAAWPPREQIIEIIGRAVADNMPDRDDITDAIERGAHAAMSEHLRAK